MEYSIEGQEIFDTISQKIKDLFILNKILPSKFLLYVVVAILAVKIISIAVYLPIPQNFFYADITKIDLLNLLNQQRRGLGLNTLVENETLNKAAMAKAQDMVRNGYFAHQSPQGITPWFWFKQAGYVYKYAGENLAVGFVDSTIVYDAWVNSPSHQANLLNKNYTEVGTAVLGGFQDNSMVVVQFFGSPQFAMEINSKPQITNHKSPSQSDRGSSIESGQVLSQKLENPKPEPAPIPAATTQESTNTTVNQRVLSGSTQYIVGPEHAGVRNFYVRFLNFIVYDNSRIEQYLSFGCLALIIFCFMINIFLGTSLADKKLVFRSVLLASLLATSIFINKDIISHIFSYQVLI